MKKLGVAVVSGLLCVALVAGVALVGSSPNYALNWDVLARGGNEMASASYTLKSTTGQTAIGPAGSTNYQMGAGYWYGVGEVQFNVYLPLVLRNP